MDRRIAQSAAALGLVLLAACNPAPRKEAAVQAGPAEEMQTTTTGAEPALATDAWVGRWLGPEGLFLDIKARDPSGGYPITLKDNLDSQADYVAQPAGDDLTFTRGDDTVTIKPGTGPDTGFKYLVDKRDCLILVPGQEGYCRD